MVTRTVSVDIARVKLLQERRVLLATRISVEGARSIVDVVTTDVSVQIAEIKARKLAEVDRALKLMEEGRWGTCEECGGPIDPKRLDAKIDATACRNCAEQAEEEVRRRAKRNRPGMSFPPMLDQRR